jgi:signal recognition particle subunit SRP54
MSLAFWNYLKRPKAYGLLVVMLDAVLQQQRVQLFFGTGEHMDEFEAFETKSFVSHLLSMGDWSAFVDKIDEVVPMDQQSELMQN